MPDQITLQEALEAVCEFMERCPATLPLDFRPWRGISLGGWWVSTPIVKMECVWTPCTLDLDRLREVEERLSLEQWSDYDRLLSSSREQTKKAHWWAIHASAEQKTMALATVIGGAK